MKTIWMTQKLMVVPLTVLCAIGIGCEPPDEEYYGPDTIELDTETVDAEPQIPDVEVPDPEPPPQPEPVEPPMTVEEDTDEVAPPATS